MYHLPLPPQSKPELDYSKVTKPTQKETLEVPSDDSVPTAPDGFVFYRIQSGDTLVSLSVRFGLSQSKIRRYNPKVCFGHRLTHILGKLLLIPVGTITNLSTEIMEQLNKIYAEDDKERTKTDKGDEGDETKHSEPDENGQYQLKKALMFHAKGIDEHRAAYYLGEANWNVRKALNIWRDDDKWEKKHLVMKQCKLTEDEAKELLDNYHWNVLEAIKQHKKNQNKKEGKTTPGSTEMQTIKKPKNDKTQSLVAENEEFNNKYQGSLTSGCCK